MVVYLYGQLDICMYVSMYVFKEVGIQYVHSTYLGTCL